MKLTKKQRKRIFLISILLVLGIVLLYNLKSPYSVFAPSTSSEGGKKIFSSKFLGVAGTQSCSDMANDPDCAGDCLECPDGNLACCSSGFELESRDCKANCVHSGGGSCSNDPSKMPDCSRWCDNPSDVIDYNCGERGATNSCCPGNFPFMDGSCLPAGLCYTTPQPNSRNYYTENSECSLGQEDCIGNTYRRCIEKQTWIYGWQSEGFVKGKCDVECLKKNDCGNNEVCENYKCVITQPINIIQGWICTDDRNDAGIKVEWKGKSTLSGANGDYAIQEAEIGNDKLIFSKEGYTTSEYPFNYEGGIKNIVIEGCPLKKIEICGLDTKTCPDGSIVKRNPDKNCDFDDCPIVECNSDGTCDEGETLENCPEDCIEKPATYAVYIIIGIIVLFIIGLVYLYFKTKTKKR